MKTLGFLSEDKTLSVTVREGASGLCPDTLIEAGCVSTVGGRSDPFSRLHGVAAEPRRSLSLCALILLAFCVLNGSVAVAQTTAPSTPTSAIETQAVPRTRQVTSGTEDRGVGWKTLASAMFIVLGLIVGLKYAAVWLFPGARTGVAGRGVRVLARTPIAPRQQVLLLHVGRRILVVGDSGGSLNPLANIDEPDEVAELLGQISSTTTATASSKFRAMFGRAERDYELSPESLTAADDLSNPQQSQPTEANITAAQNEISGLLERMRNLSKQVKK